MNKIKDKLKKQDETIKDLKDLIDELEVYTILEDCFIDEKIKDIQKEIKCEDDIMYASHLIILRDKVKEVLNEKKWNI